MTEEKRIRLQELRQKEQLNDEEFAEFEVLERIEKNEPVIERFKENQKAPYDQKVARAENLAWEFYHAVDGQAYVAVGGLDSITLYLFLRSIGINVPAVSASALEDKSIQRVHKALGVKALKPEKPKVSVIRDFGWPVLSKEIAGKISLLQHPSEKNATVRHAIITGETGKQGGYQKKSRMRLSQKWLNLFGGYENEKEGVENGNLRTTKAQRTGCSMCGFGIQKEKRPHRFDLLFERNPKEWELWMNHVVQRDDGTWYGWGHVLDYIGVEWRDPEKALKKSGWL